MHVAIPLTAEQRGRLRAALADTYGRDVQLNVVLDPQVIGGISVRISDEIIDGSMASRLAGSSAGWRPEQLQTYQARDPDEKDARTMAELTIRPEEIRDALARFVEEYEPEGAATQEVGIVAEAVTASPGSKACPRPWPTSCSSSRTAPAAWR